jgi:hypothetical protein
MQAMAISHCLALISFFQSIKCLAFSLYLVEREKERKCLMCSVQCAIPIPIPIPLPIPLPVKSNLINSIESESESQE